MMLKQKEQISYDGTFLKKRRSVIANDLPLDAVLAFAEKRGLNVEVNNGQLEIIFCETKELI